MKAMGMVSSESCVMSMLEKRDRFDRPMALCPCQKKDIVLVG